MKSELPPLPRRKGSSITRPRREVTDVLMERGLPANIDAEKFILGSVLLDDSRFAETAGVLTNDDFALEKHRRIFARMHDLHARDEAIDRITLANELLKYNELESVDGLSYLISLDDGLPRISHLDSYLNIVRDKATLRRIAIAAEHPRTRAIIAEEDPGVILSGAEQMLQRLRDGAAVKVMSVADVPLMATFAAQKLDWIVHTIIAAGTVNLFTGDAGSGKTILISAICFAIANGEAFSGLRTQQRPVLYLDKENPFPITAERFDRLGITDSADFKVWDGWCPSEPPSPSSPTLLQYVRSCEVKPVIVIDSFGGFSAGTDENSATEIRKWMDGPRRLADLGATAIVLHNSSNKTDTGREYRGSTAFKDATDVGFCVSNLNPDPSRLSSLRVKVFKGRFAVAPEIVFHYVDGEFRTDTRLPAQTAIEAFRDLLIANPGIGSREFQGLATEKRLGRNKSRDFLKNGIAEQTIRVDESGTHNEQRHTWIGSLLHPEIEGGL